MTASVSNLPYILKTLYPQGLPKDTTYQDFPFLSLIQRNTNFYGENMAVPLKYGNNSGRSATFSTAQTNSDYTKGVKFVVTRSSDYAIAQIANELLEASERDPGAFVAALKQEVDGAMKAAVISEAISLAEDGTGYIARFAASVNVATAVAQLADPETVVRFEVGQTVQLSATKGGAAKAGSLVISAVDRDQGILTFSGNISAGVATAAASDYIAIQGDVNLKPKGFSAWIPESDPSATPFFGVDRTPDLVRLSGVRDDYSALPIEEAMVKALKRVHREGSNADYAFINFEKFAELENALGSKVQYVDVMAKEVGLGFRGIKVNSGKRPVTVLADMTVPSDRLWVVQNDTWQLASLKESIRILDQDGNKMLRLTNEDALEVRIGGYKQFICNAPGYNGNFQI